MWWEPWDLQLATCWEESWSASMLTPKRSSTLTRTTLASLATGEYARPSVLLPLCIRIPRVMISGRSNYLFFEIFRWSGFLLCAIAMLLVIFPMFAFPKKLPPRHKKRKKKKMGSPGDVSSDDDVMKEKSSSKGQNVSSSMGFGKDIKGEKLIISALLFHPLYLTQRNFELLMYKLLVIQSMTWISHVIQ